MPAIKPMIVFGEVQSIPSARTAISIGDGIAA